jgi:hypothetical protein
MRGCDRGRLAAPLCSRDRDHLLCLSPVTAAGEPAPGYTVTTYPGSGKIACYGQSTSSMSPDVEVCGSSADAAYSSQKAAAPHRLLCLLDARKRTLLERTYQGTFTPVPPANSTDTAPMDITLADGTRCVLREGGADGTVLRGHRSWAPLYYCNNKDAVWTPELAAHHGIDESSAAWMVRTAPQDGKGPVVTRRVVTAYFVGPATT